MNFNKNNFYILFFYFFAASIFIIFLIIYLDFVFFDGNHQEGATINYFTGYRVIKKHPLSSSVALLFMHQKQPYNIIYFWCT